MVIKYNSSFMSAQNQPGKSRRGICYLICVVTLLPVLLKGDQLEMSNGDRYVGNVISVTQSNVTFQSEIQGRMNLSRDKVARVSFGEAAARTPAVAPTVAPSKPKTNDVIKPLPKLDFDSKSLSQVQQDLLSTASPEARRQFNETVKGLMIGKLSIDDIRAQARNSVKEIKAAREELGEEGGGVLDGYLHILEHFLSETDKPEAIAPIAKPNATNSVPATAPQK